MSMRETDKDISKAPRGGGTRTQADVPSTLSRRLGLREAIRRYVHRVRPVPPLSLSQLHRHCERIIRTAKADPKHIGFITVLTNNELWRDTLRDIPYERRLLLLPQCLRDPRKCRATSDEYGLLCAHCGACMIDTLQSEAERLGYLVLITEGTPVVTSLIETGRIDAMIGVSCLSSLERIFPFIEAGAIPAMAIPLLRDGCKDTAVDVEWVWDAIYLSGERQMRPLRLDNQRGRVRSWFTPEVLGGVMGPAGSETERIGRDWLMRGGKRWRPVLTVCAAEAFCGDGEGPDGDALRSVAVAVECFHKASLIHDDIEDGEARRYGDQTLHRRWGIPIALNVGDFLLGEGYRLLGRAPVSPHVRVEMLRAAAEGHHSLCIGQGDELCWMRRGGPLSPDEVLKIFAQKTAPAFEVALRIGSLLNGATEAIRDVIHDYSEALGIAYQISDDLADLANPGEAVRAMRPSLLGGLAWAKAGAEDRRMLQNLWESDGSEASYNCIRRIILDLKVDQTAREMLNDYKRRAVEALDPLKSVASKAPLRRVLAKIFNEFERKEGSVESKV